MGRVYTRIIETLKEEGEPLFLGEIVCAMESHWFVVKKALDNMIDGGMVRRCEKYNKSGNGFRYELV